MARTESKAIMGYLPIDAKHHDAIISLIAPATPAHRLLEPFAGEGEFLDVASKTWNVTPYANELDGDRAQQCIHRFGPKQAVRSDVERLIASNNAFSVEKHIERGGNAIVLGAVDNHLARRELSRLKDTIWIDCGNHHNAGQVVIGNTASIDKVQEHFAYAQKHVRNTVSYLPNATTIYPSLLEPETESETTLSCSELTQLGE